MMLSVLLCVLLLIFEFLLAWESSQGFASGPFSISRVLGGEKSLACFYLRELLKFIAVQAPHRGPLGQVVHGSAPTG